MALTLGVMCVTRCVRVKKMAREKVRVKGGVSVSVFLPRRRCAIAYVAVSRWAIVDR